MANRTHIDQSDITNYLEFANNIADNARKIALELFRHPKKQWTKPDSTWVTEADYKIEEMARNMVSKHFPDHDFFGEEFGDVVSNRSMKWCIDPIDGTMPFVYGLPTFGVLIALTYKAEPIVGIIESPAMKERWCGALDTKTTWQGQTCQTNSKEVLSDAVVFATSIDMFTDDEREVFNRVSLSAKERRFGADCYAYGVLASGLVDVVMESDMKPYDMMALVPVVEGAGGVMTDWEGSPLTLSSGRQTLATANRKLHEECLNQIHSN